MECKVLGFGKGIGFEDRWKDKETVIAFILVSFQPKRSKTDSIILIRVLWHILEYFSYKIGENWDGEKKLLDDKILDHQNLTGLPIDKLISTWYVIIHVLTLLLYCTCEYPESCPWLVSICYAVLWSEVLDTLAPLMWSGCL